MTAALPSRDELVKLLRQHGYSPDIVREYVVTVRTRRHRKGSTIYEEAEAHIAISLPREYAGRKLRIIVIGVPIDNKREHKT